MAAHQGLHRRLHQAVEATHHLRRRRPGDDDDVETRRLGLVAEGAVAGREQAVGGGDQDTVEVAPRVARCDLLDLPVEVLQHLRRDAGDVDVLGLLAGEPQRVADPHQRQVAQLPRPGRALPGPSCQLSTPRGAVIARKRRRTSRPGAP